MGEFGKFEIVIFLVLGLVASTHADFKVGYYDDTCPNAERIVREYVANHLPSGTPTLAASLVRLHFHDCFVEGCDASVLLENTTTSGNNTEKTSIINHTLKGYDFINGVKKELERNCSGIVSCADTLALAARDAVYLSGGPSWDVPTGRKDGSVSNATQPLIDLPFPTDNITELERKFKNKGLNQKDLVYLSGAHTLGKALCTSFAVRLYNFTGKGDQDPTLDRKYADELKNKCPAPNSAGSVTMDANSDPKKFGDIRYYDNLLIKKGLFESDEALLTNPTTNTTVHELASGSHEEFFDEFAIAMVKMSSIGVKTDSSQGNVRTHCAFVS